MTDTKKIILSDQLDLTPTKAEKLEKGFKVTLKNGDIGVVKAVSNGKVFVPERTVKLVAITAKMETGAYAGLNVELTLEADDKLVKHTKTTKPQRMIRKFKSWLAG